MNLNKLHLIIHDIDFKSLQKNVAQNNILFQLLMVLLQQIILHNSETIFWKEYKN